MLLLQQLTRVREKSVLKSRLTFGLTNRLTKIDVQEKQLVDFNSDVNRHQSKRQSSSMTLFLTDHTDFTFHRYRSAREINLWNRCEQRRSVSLLLMALLQGRADCPSRLQWWCSHRRWYRWTYWCGSLKCCDKCAAGRKAVAQWLRCLADFAVCV